jgi:Spherulation-specific family 4
MSPFVGPDPGSALSPNEQRDIVPAYFRPHLHDDDDVSLWRKIAAVMKPGSIAVMNPASGPGAGEDEYVQAIDLCHFYRRQLRVIGYVSTDYGRRPLSEVVADIEAYVAHYPRLDGVFLDELNNNAQQPLENVGSPNVSEYYAAVHAKVSARPRQIIVGNPGNVSDSQGEWAFDFVDVLVTNESQAAAYLAWNQPDWVYPGTDRDHAYRNAHLVHGVPRSIFRAAPSQEKRVWAASRARHAGYVYVTDETAPPEVRLWDRLPKSWDDRLPYPLPVKGR